MLARLEMSFNFRNVNIHMKVGKKFNYTAIERGAKEEAIEMAKETAGGQEGSIFCVLYLGCFE